MRKEPLAETKEQRRRADLYPELVAALKALIQEWDEDERITGRVLADARAVISKAEKEVAP